MKSRKLLPLASSFCCCNVAVCLSAELRASVGVLAAAAVVGVFSAQDGGEAGSFVNCEDLGSKEEKTRVFEAFRFGQGDSVREGRLSLFLAAEGRAGESVSEASLLKARASSGRSADSLRERKSRISVAGNSVSPYCGGLFV